MAGTAVVYDIIARDRASATFRKVAGSAASTEKRMMAVSRTLTSAGRTMTHAFTVPIALAGAASVKLASDFQSSMERIHTQAGASQKDVESLTKSVLALAGKAQQSPKDLADSLYHLKSVGMDNVDAMKALKQASDFAAVGGANLEDTTNALAGAWRSGVKGAHNFKGAAATLNAVIGAGNMKMQDLNSALSTGILASARSFGVSLKSVGSALALMTDEGIPAQQAATRLRMSLSLLAAPSGAADKALQGIGLTGHRLGEEMRKPNGLIKSIELLHKHLTSTSAAFYPNQKAADAFVARMTPVVKPLLDKKHLTKAQQSLVEQYGMAKENHSVMVKGGLDPAEQAAVLSKAFGGGRSSSAIMTLLNNLDVLQQKQKQVDATATKSRFGDSVAKQAQTAAAKFALFKSSLEVAGVTIGNILLPYLTKLAGWIGHVADAFSHLSPKWQKIIVAAAGFLAVLGPLLVMAGSLIRAIKEVRDVFLLLNVAMDANPIGIVIVAIAALAAGLIYAYKHSKTFRDIVNGAFHDIATVAHWLWNNVLKPVFKFIIDAWMNVAGAIINGAAHAFGWVPGIGDKLKKAAAWFNQFKDRVNQALDGIHKSVTIGVYADTSHAGVLLNQQLRNAGQGGAGKAMGHRAYGGPVRAGQAYVVNEQGQEMFIPDRNGTVVPHGQSGHGKTVNIYIDKMMPHNYSEFTAEIDKRDRTRSLGVLAS